MAEIEATHKARFIGMYGALRKLDGKILALGSGCCTQCTHCTYSYAPFRFPEKRISSMEAYGMLVAEVCKANNMKYHYGPNMIPFTSCFLAEEYLYRYRHILLARSQDCIFRPIPI